MSAQSVVRILETRHLGRRYVWQAAGGGAVHRWLTTTNQSPIPNYAGGGMCCFHLPLIAAFLSGDLSRDAAGDLIFEQMNAGFNGEFPEAWAPNGICRYHIGSLCCIPIRSAQEALNLATPIHRGDVIFLSAAGLPYFAHVAIATGNGTETISFGHGAGFLGGAPLPVERRTIYELVDDFDNQITQIHYGAPPW